MKKKILFSIGLLFAFLSHGQQVSDALRYGQDELSGTARYRALSGAFGALGGDLTAISYNPAGAAVFTSSSASITTTLMNTNTDSEFFNGKSSDSKTLLDLNQAGVVLVFNNLNSNSKIKKFTLGFTYDRIANYRNNWFAQGINPNNSIANYFLDYAQGNRLDEISAFPDESYSDAYADIGYYYGYGNQQAFLGYESYIIDPDPNDPNAISNPDAVTSYVSSISGGNYNQQYDYAARGYNGKIAVNFAAQVGESVYLGLNLNSHFTNYDRSTYFYEGNSNASSTVNRVDFENNLYTLGYGFSFQLGGIFKVTNGLRLGLVYNSPTWYSIDEETTQYIATVRNEGGSNITQVVNPNVINVFPRYRIQNPGKFTGSLAYVFGEKGLISFDYSYRDFSNTKFKPTSDSYFRTINNEISNTLTGVSTYRIGGEFKIKQVSLRAGYRTEESPYKNGSSIGDLTGCSLGVGYSLGKLKFDLTYDYSQLDYNYQFFETGLTDPISLQTNNNNITFTASFSL